MKVITLLALCVTLFCQGYSSKRYFFCFIITITHYYRFISDNMIHVSNRLSLHSCVTKIPICPVGFQTPWTRVRVGVVMGQTVISPVSVTHPVNATVTVVQTTLNCAKVRAKSRFLLYN